MIVLDNIVVPVGEALDLSDRESDTKVGNTHDKHLTSYLNLFAGDLQRRNHFRIRGMEWTAHPYVRIEYYCRGTSNRTINGGGERW